MLHVQEFVPGRIWLIEYPIRYFGMHIYARTSLIKGQDGALIVHSGCPLDDETRHFVDGLGSVASIVVPGNFHHMYAAEWDRAYPDAELFASPGVARKSPALRHARLIEDGVQYPWSSELDHRMVQGNWIIREVAFLHRATRTLILTDVIEYFTDDTPSDWQVRFWLKTVFRMWDRPAFAPEYRMLWRDRSLARQSLEAILAWDFDRIVIGHGELVHADGKAAARRAWASIVG
jgi:Domain of unknown function (DUF4336)